MCRLASGIRAVLHKLQRPARSWPVLATTCQRCPYIRTPAHYGHRPPPNLPRAGAKKVQQDLARPGVLERFLPPAPGTPDLRAFFAGLWGLDDLQV